MFSCTSRLVVLSAKDMRLRTVPLPDQKTGLLVAFRTLQKKKKRAVTAAYALSLLSFLTQQIISRNFPGGPYS